MDKKNNGMTIETASALEQYETMFQNTARMLRVEFEALKEAGLTDLQCSLIIAGRIHILLQRPSDT